MDREMFKDYGIRMDPELAFRMTKVAIRLGEIEGRVGPVALDSLARRAIRWSANRQNINLAETCDDRTSKQSSAELMVAAEGGRKVWVKYPREWSDDLDKICADDRASLHLSQVWRQAIDEFCEEKLDSWAKDAEGSTMAEASEDEEIA